ncbi:MAG: ATP-binding protein [Acidimicrobiales bacterium]
MTDCLELAPDPGSVRSARLFVVDKLQEWSCDELVDSAALITSELATNAVVHTGRPYTVTVHRKQGGIRVEVRDAMQDRPLVHRPRHMAKRDGEGVGDIGSLDGSVEVNDLFSGLGMVDAVATAWGSEVIPGAGKIVWFELATTIGTGGSSHMSELRDLRSPEPEEGLPAEHLGKGRENTPRTQEAQDMARRDSLVDDHDRVVDERRYRDDDRRRGGGVMRWILVLLVIAALAIGAFFLFGGEADVDTEGDLEVPEVDVDVNAPDVDVDSEEAPPAEADADTGS